MIASLRGRVAAHTATTTVLDVGGVGYRLATTASAARIAAAAGDGEVTLLTHLHVREDVLALFGFASEAERTLFELLLGVSGVGPKAALAIVSGYAPDQIRRAVATGDHALFTSINGIGRRTAERVVIDLKDKVAGMGSLAPAPDAAEPRPADGHTDARDALVGLGMSVSEAEAALRSLDPDLPVEERVRLALAGAVPAGAGG
jgi:Holliday junction DNA helicase RuvA